MGYLMAMTPREYFEEQHRRWGAGEPALPGNMVLEMTADQQALGARWMTGASDNPYRWVRYGHTMRRALNPQFVHSSNKVPAFPQRTRFQRIVGAVKLRLWRFWFWLTR
jgi:hypothetical protein